MLNVEICLSYSVHCSRCLDIARNIFKGGIMIELSTLNASILVRRINEKRDQFNNHPSFLAVVDSIEKELKEFTKSELEWIYTTVYDFEDQLPSYDGDIEQAKKELLEIRRKINRQIKTANKL